MPFPGDIVEAGARVASMRSVSRVLGRAERAAAAVGDDVLIANARRPFELQALSEPQLHRFLARYRRDLVWIDEGNCFNRAMYGAHLLGDMTGVGRSPLADTFAGAIAVHAYRHEGATYTGGFHAALMVRVQGMPEPQVIDLLSGNPTLVPRSQWYAGSAGTTEVIRPFAGTGVWNGVAHRDTWVGPSYFRFARGMLHDSWQRHVAVA